MLEPWDPERKAYVQHLANRVASFGEMVTHPTFGPVYGRLLAGDSVYAIVDTWQAGLPPDDPLAKIPRRSLARRLYRFRAALPEEVFLPELTIEKQYYRSAALDVLHEMAGAIRYQKARIDSFAEAEKSFPVPVEQQRRELLTLTEMLHQYWLAMVGLGVAEHAPSAQPAEPTQPALSSDLGIALLARPAQIPRMLELFDAMDERDAERARVARRVGGDAPAAS